MPQTHASAIIRREPSFADQWKWFRYDIKNWWRYGHRDFFNDFNIEINTSCNRRCTYCPNSVFDRGLIKNERLLDEALYRKLIDELASVKFRGRISPQLYGEPLLDKRLVDLMAYTRRALPRARIILISNGDMLTVDAFQALVRAGVDKFSITQHGPEMSGAMRALFAHLEDKPDWRKRIRYNVFSADMPLYNRGGLVHPAVVNTTPRCADPGNPVAIDAAGNVILCCHDYLGSVILGNLKHESLLDIWFGEKYRNIRRRLRRGEYSLPICRKCVGAEWAHDAAYKDWPTGWVASPISLGREQGFLNALCSLVNDGMIPITVATAKANMSEDEFKARMQTLNPEQKKE